MPGLVHILTHSNTHRHTCNEVLIDSYINTRLSLHLPMQTHTHTLQLLLHVSALRAPGPSAQTFSTSPLMENCSPFTSLFHILAAALSISFTAVTIALTDGPSTALHSHNARNPDITQYPERVRGDTCCSFTDTPVHRVTGRQVCGLKARGRFVRLDMNDTSKDMSIFFPAERTEDWKNPLIVIHTIIYQSS